MCCSYTNCIIFSIDVYKRQSNSYVYYDFFINFASFDPDSKLFSINVDRVNEDLSMKDAIDEFEELERSLRNVHPDILSDEDIADYEQSLSLIHI